MRKIRFRRQSTESLEAKVAEGWSSFKCIAPCNVYVVFRVASILYRGTNRSFSVGNIQEFHITINMSNRNE